MKLFGEFRDINGELCSVEINTPHDPFTNDSKFRIQATGKANVMGDQFRRKKRGYPVALDSSTDSSVGDSSVADSSTDAWTGDTPDVWIGEDGIWFAGDPFTTECEMEDTFEHIIKHTGKLRLVVSKYVGDLVFATDARQNKIVVKRGDKTLFSGYITMNVYEQPYNTMADQFEIECIDKLATLNQYNYRGTTPETYLNKAANATTVSFLDVLKDSLDGLDGDVWYDSTKSIDGSTYADTLEKIGVGEQIFFGEDFDEMLDKEEALRQVLQYMNLHIVQEGEDFYLYDWMSMKRKAEPEWVEIRNDNTDASVSPRRRPEEEPSDSSFVSDDTFYNAVVLKGDMHMSNDTTINIGDVYSQIQVNCELEEAEDLLTDFFDDDNMYSNFSNMEKYVTEYISEGEGSDARNCFLNMIKGESDTYDSGSMTDWYMQVMQNKNWIMNPDKPIYPNFIQLGAYDETLGKQQYIIPDHLAKQSCRAALLKWGNIKRKASELENADPVSQIKMTNYLYISINGNEMNDEATARPSDADIAANEPIVVYNGNVVSGSFSPADDETTNYIVFDGKVVLQPIQYESLTMPFLGNSILPLTVPSKNNDDGRFYARKWYKYLTPKDEEPSIVGWTDPNCAGYRFTDFYSNEKKIAGRGLMPPAEDNSLPTRTIDKHEDPFKYSYSSVGDSTDHIFKIPLLECELRIGDKKAVEYNIDADGHSDFMWCRDGEEPDLIIAGKDTGRKATTFTIGINPKIGDIIIGTEFDIQNTISFKQNIDASGTAIPIKRDDALTGNVSFKILGPCPTMWNQIIRIHPTFWRHTDWKEDYLSVLANTANIIIKEFSCKIYSDNALNTDNADNDLMYVAQETDYNFNTKNEIDFSIVTQVDSKTAKEKGIKAGVYTNGAVDMTTNKPLTYLYTKKYGMTVKRKAEEHYAYDYCEEWRKPAVVMTTTLKDDKNVDFKYLYYSKPLNKKFMVQAIGRNVKKASATLRLKEITS